MSPTLDNETELAIAEITERVLITLDKFETRDSRDAGGPLVLPRARCLVLVRSWPAGGMRRYAAAETLTGLFAGITSFASRGKENRSLLTLFAELVPYELSLHHRDKKRYPVVRDCKK
ncbi:hypothetical protein HZH66_001215 [Vespula vulgaris]|uniref:Uncharacterized protein n=1 Tax=Vespula vulgaris TaxID=7454 RepID=A0A834KW24_VESVU|nr:hypothetical protein HZH66_001215 [Vespula vulgaris]